ncbi:MAG: FtsX-like permease family protein [Bacteroidales bacterium]
MKENFKLAWRNLWRNRRRTTITSASILFAVFFALLMRSMQLGSYDNMIKNVIEKYSGFIKIQNVNFEDDKSIDNVFEFNSEMINKLRSLDGVKAVVPRIESGAFISTGDLTKAVVILGVDAEHEKQLSNPESMLVRYRIDKQCIDKLNLNKNFPPKLIEKIKSLENNSYSNSKTLNNDLDLNDKEKDYIHDIENAAKFNGENLSPGDPGILVSDRLAKFLKVQIGDSIILMGQGYHGVTAQGLFPIKGIIKVPAPDLDNKLIYMEISQAEKFFELNNQLTSIAVNLFDNSNDNLTKTRDKIASLLNNDNLSVEHWKQFNKILWQQIEGDSQTGQAMLALLYFIIFFGIFGTVLMMIHERYKEFGVLVSIGMQKIKLSVVILIEMVYMGIIGVSAGIALSLPLLYLGNRYPIRLTGEMAKTMESVGQEALLPLAWVDMYVLWQAVIVSLMVVLSCIYPLIKVIRLKEVEALRS